MLLFSKIWKTGIATEVLQASDPTAVEIGRTLEQRITRLLGRALAIREVDAGSCHGCELEITGLTSPVYDMERFGMHFVASPRHADLLLVTGPVTRNMEVPLRRTYEATPAPKLVVAVGDCARTCGVFNGSYAVVGPVDRVVPVDIYISGCPPEPSDILRGILEGLDRFEQRRERGSLNTSLARDHGALGYVGRASGLDLDARRDHPFAAYPQLSFRVPVYTTGDVKARTAVRLDEIRQSASLIAQACRSLPPGPVAISVPRPDSFRAAFGIVEGWRGRIAHWVMTDDDGALHRVKVVDPSFFNWPALSYALDSNIVPDFPLCNKSFNQSYSGNDL